MEYIELLNQFYTHKAMKKLPAFFAIGTIGMILTAVLHMFLAFIIHESSVHTAFFVMYPTFFSFLMIGTGQMIKASKTA